MTKEPNTLNVYAFKAFGKTFSVHITLKMKRVIDLFTDSVTHSIDIAILILGKISKVKCYKDIHCIETKISVTAE